MGENDTKTGGGGIKQNGQQYKINIKQKMKEMGDRRWGCKAG